jgi:hypothetical protein
MRKRIIVAALALALIPGSAMASDTSPDDAAKAAKAACKAEKHEVGTKVFKKTYAARSTSKAMKACIAKTESAGESESEKGNAKPAKTCKTMRTEDKAAFEAEYGTKKNAFGKCVSATAKARNKDDDQE